MIMAHKVEPDKVQALLEYVEAEVPEIEILYKDEPLPTWWLKFVFLMVRLVGLISPSFADTWFNRVSNSIGKKYIIFPNRKDWSDFTDYSTYVIFRHELVHTRDVRRWGIFFLLTYVLLPLPTLFAGRAHWEFRGYAQNMIVRYEERGEISDSYLDWIESQYTGSLYFWMWPWRRGVRKRLERLRDDIYSGKVSGFYPDLTWFQRSRT